MMALVPIPGTRRQMWPGSSFAHAIESDAELLLTAWLHPGSGSLAVANEAAQIGATRPAVRTYRDRKSLMSETDADPVDVERLRSYCEQSGIDVVDRHWRSVVLRAPLSRYVEAFAPTIAIFNDGSGGSFRHRSGSLHAPREIASIIRGIFGLHQWPRSHKLGTLTRRATPLSAAEIACRYSFPDCAGRGETIAILQLRGEFRKDDFDRCMVAQGVAPPRPRVKRIDNADLAHAVETVKDLEAALDVQIAAALAPAAQIVIYGAPDDERGILDALRDAIFDEEVRPSIVSVSYGFPEYLWTPAALDILNDLFAAAALLGISVFCSSGDNGAEIDAAGIAHVVAPASCSFAHACGATVVPPDSPEREAAWPNGGGGFSSFFDAPPWQTSARSEAAALGVSAGRGVPDVAGAETPGYLVYLNGFELAAGGTSAVAPMWAALTARLNERLGTRAGFFAPLLYGNASAPLHDVVEGGNDRYRAHAGWNPCTGLGVPDGVALENAMRAD